MNIKHVYWNYTKDRRLPRKGAPVDFTTSSLALLAHQLHFHSKLLKFFLLPKCTQIHAYTAMIYISKALVFQNYLTTCCTAGDSETETQRAKALNTRSKRKTQHPTKLKAPVATVATLLPAQSLTTGTNTSGHLRYLFDLLIGHFYAVIFFLCPIIFFSCWHNLIIRRSINFINLWSVKWLM